MHATIGKKMKIFVSSKIHSFGSGTIKTTFEFCRLAKGRWVAVALTWPQTADLDAIQAQSPEFGSCNISISNKVRGLPGSQKAMCVKLQFVLVDRM